MKDSDYRSGKARVREVLIGPIEAEGLRKRRETTRDQHGEFLEALAGRLAYMTEEGLRTLRPFILQNAGGKGRNTWPGLAPIANMAEAIERRPVELNEGCVRYMRSAAGRRAWEVSPARAVALVRYLFTTKRPPSAGGEVQISRWQDEYERGERRVLEFIDNGKADANDRAWHENYRQMVDRARALVEGVELPGERDAA